MSQNALPGNADWLESRDKLCHFMNQCESDFECSFKVFEVSTELVFLTTERRPIMLICTVSVVKCF